MFILGWIRKTRVGLYIPSRLKHLVQWIRKPNACLWIEIPRRTGLARSSPKRLVLVCAQRCSLERVISRSQRPQTGRGIDGKELARLHTCVQYSRSFHRCSSMTMLELSSVCRGLYVGCHRHQRSEAPEEEGLRSLTYVLDVLGASVVVVV
jgi:hypothetical protein